MFHPVGSQPPNVYWRRRLVVLGAIVIVVVLIAVTVSALTSGSSGAPSGQGSTGPAAASGPSTSASTSHPASSKATTSSAAGHSSSTPSGSSGAPSTPASTAPPATCTKSDLEIQAVVGQSTYQVGQKPTVELRVMNVGSAPCVQDLADKQVLLKVYNGESRVWGSHDCEIQPGTMLRTLAVGAPVQVSVDWSGTTSRPHCAGRRQQVGAGTYTLYATLSGKTGKAAQFTIN